MELDLHLPGAPVAAAAARSLMEGLGDSVPEELLDDARLLLSELVTNAIRHGGARSGGDVAVRISAKPDRLRVEVADAGSGFSPGRPAPHEGQIGGWGLYLVDQIADRWGVAQGEGCTVWFELDRSTRSAA